MIGSPAETRIAPTRPAGWFLFEWEPTTLDNPQIMNEFFIKWKKSA